ncbi:MAG: nitrous oxide reductase accessory protein NosL [Euryarchaeota archaeon]|nr:nitrous oxide reductase accessory protein NosL [Euryarchaeota archaeon]
MRTKALILMGFLLLFAACTGKPAESAQVQEEPAVAPVEPTMDDKCPVCGMMPAKYPEWRAQVVLKSGERYHFDSPKDMFRFLLGLSVKNEPKHWVDASEVAAVFVTDYATKQYADARKAYYVKGSEVRGPMGEDLVPFARSEDAHAFASQHGGEVLTYEEVTAEVVKGLGGMAMGGMEGMEGMQMEMGEGEMKM